MITGWQPPVTNTKAWPPTARDNCDGVCQSLLRCLLHAINPLCPENGGVGTKRTTGADGRPQVSSSFLRILSHSLWKNLRFLAHPHTRTHSLVVSFPPAVANGVVKRPETPPLSPTSNFIPNTREGNQKETKSFSWLNFCFPN